MAYIPDFEYDIFISYAHVDNLSTSGNPKWVEVFHNQLEISLAKRIGKMGLIKIWRDKRLEGDQLFDETIQSSIDNAALFLALTSNSYLASDYCKKELNVFYNRAKSDLYGIQIEDRSRISNALLNNTPHEDWPEEYGRSSGYPFHDAEDEETFGEPTDPGEKLFQKQLRELVDSLHKKLIKFKELPEARTAPPDEVNDEPAEAEKGPTVFIADITDSHRTVRTRIINELQQKGINVISNTPSLRRRNS